MVNSSPLVPHICVTKSGQHCIRQWLVAYFAPSHYLDQCWLVSTGPLGTNFSEILITIPNCFIHEHAYENIVCEMASNLSKGRSVNWWYSRHDPQLPRQSTLLPQNTHSYFARCLPRISNVALTKTIKRCHYWYAEPALSRTSVMLSIKRLRLVLSICLH